MKDFLYLLINLPNYILLSESQLKVYFLYSLIIFEIFIQNSGVASAVKMATLTAWGSFSNANDRGRSLVIFRQKDIF